MMLYYVGAPVLAGARPVPVDPRNYRNFRRGDIIVSLAGVTANLGIAIGCAIASFALGLLGNAAPGLSPVCGILQAMTLIGVLLNLILAAFNLLPIPPLDGSHVFKYLLPPALAMRYQQIGFFGILLVLLLLRFQVLSYWLAPAYGAALAIHSSLDSRSLLLPSAVPWLKAFYPA